MTQVVPGSAFLLIGLIPSLADLEIARVLGWYRIPIKSAPKIINVDYYAFYQGANLGLDHRWRVEYFAEYRGHELTTRGELLRNEPDHPRAKEEYYKVQLGPLIQMTSPIQAGSWKRITFLYTTGALFNRARIINDLVVRTEERDVLWKNLRERAAGSAAYQAGEMPEGTLPPEVLNFLLGLNNAMPGQDMENY